MREWEIGISNFVRNGRNETWRLRNASAAAATAAMLPIQPALFDLSPDSWTLFPIWPNINKDGALVTDFETNCRCECQSHSSLIFFTFYCWDETSQKLGYETITVTLKLGLDLVLLGLTLKAHGCQFWGSRAWVNCDSCILFLLWTPISRRFIGFR